MIVSQCRAHLKHCSRGCYLKSLELDPQEIARLARMYDGNRRTAAKILDIPYSTFYQKLKKQGLNNLFTTLRRRKHDHEE
jgi:transcriptional regulator of acetoin/glycerol metabolism